MKRSIGFRTHAVFWTSGSAGRTGAISDQCGCHFAPCSIQTPNQFDILLVEFVVARIGRWHPRRFVVRAYALVERALFRIAGYDHPIGAAFHIEAQFRFAIGCVGAVASETSVGKNRPDITIELDRGSGARQNDAKEGYDGCASGTVHEVNRKSDRTIVC